MSCCKNSNTYKFYLNGVVEPTLLKNVFSWNESKIDTILEITKTSGKCILLEVNYDEMLQISKKLAEHKIPYTVKS